MEFCCISLLVVSLKLIEQFKMRKYLWLGDVHERCGWVDERISQKFQATTFEATRLFKTFFLYKCLDRQWQKLNFSWFIEESTKLNKFKHQHFRTSPSESTSGFCFHMPFQLISYSSTLSFLMLIKIISTTKKEEKRQEEVKFVNFYSCFTEFHEKN